MSAGASPVPPVLRLGPERIAEVVDVLCEAFHDYPIMHFVLGGASADHERRLRVLVDFFVRARALRQEPFLGVDEGGRLVGVATMSWPGGEPPPALADLRRRVWNDLGADAEARYAACGEVWGGFTLPSPHAHVNMVGVRPEARGRGMARLLLDAAVEVAASRKGCVGVSLTTEDPANVPLYRRLGFDLLQQASIAPGLETWSLFRRLPSSGGGDP